METREMFLKIFKELLKEEELSVLAFSYKIEVDARLMRRWIKNGTPNLDSLIKIADYFKCSLDYLIGRTLDFDYSPSNKSIKFYTRYCLLKELANFKDSQIAVLCGISKGAVSKWKSGRIPVLEILAKLCDIFDCSLDYLVGRVD